MQENSKPDKDVELQDAKIFLFFLCHTVCRAVTVIWGQPSKKLPQIHLCTINCVQSTLQNCSSDCVFPVLLQKLRWCYIEEQRSRRRRSAQLRVWAFAVLPPASTTGRNRLDSCSFCSTHLEERRSYFHTQETTKKGFSRPWNCSLFRSIKLKSIIYDTFY